MFRSLFKLFSLASAYGFPSNPAVQFHHIALPDCKPSIVVDKTVTLTITNITTRPVNSEVNFTSTAIATLFTSTVTDVVGRTKYVTYIICTDTSTRTAYVTKTVIETAKPTTTSAINTVTSTIQTAATVTKTHRTYSIVTVNTCCMTPF